MLVLSNEQTCSSFTLERFDLVYSRLHGHQPSMQRQSPISVHRSYFGSCIDGWDKDSFTNLGQPGWWDLGLLKLNKRLAVYPLSTVFFLHQIISMFLSFIIPSMAKVEVKTSVYVTYFRCWLSLRSLYSWYLLPSTPNKIYYWPSILGFYFRSFF